MKDFNLQIVALPVSCRSCGVSVSMKHGRAHVYESGKWVVHQCKPKVRELTKEEIEKRYGPS